MVNKKIIAFVLCVLIFISGFNFVHPLYVAKAATKSELEDRIEEINEEISQNEEKLSELKGKKETQQEYLKTLESQIETVKSKAYNLQTQIELIDKELSELNTEIKQLNKEIGLIKDDIKEAEKEIKELENNIKEASKTLSLRIRAAYISGSESVLKIFLGSNSLASFLTRLELMKRTSENDKEMIVDFRESISVLEDKKATLKATKKTLDDKKNEVEEKREKVSAKKDELKQKQKEYDSTRASLEKKYTEIDDYIASLDKSSKIYQNYIKELEEEKKQADAEIDRIISEYYATMTTTTKQSTTSAAANNATTSASSDNSYATNAKWAWPLGTRWCYISSKYGYRNPNISGWGFHGGIDIAGGQGRLHGAPVYATRSGTVIAAVTSYDPKGYGIYVIIDHGDGYSSLYAHMSARYVSTGDKVSQGQKIGLVGDTGNSDGAHLHFEIRHYGQKQDPLKFVTNPN